MTVVKQEQLTIEVYDWYNDITADMFHKTVYYYKQIKRQLIAAFFI